jgi:O-6-methylguanine DNA methyltransferase
MQLQTIRIPVRDLGGVCLAASPFGVVRVHLDDDLAGFQRALKAERPDAEVLGAGPVVRRAAAAVRAYLGGGKDPVVKVVRAEDGFRAKVWREIARIPRGQTRSYGAIAKALRRPGAARAVGQACGANPVPILVPCHRVVATNGAIGGFSGDLRWKRHLLDLEGVRLRG